MRWGDQVQPARRVWPPENIGEIMLQNTDAGTRVMEAPEYAMIDLAMLQASDPEFLSIDRGVITLAGVVDYIVVRWQTPGLVVRLLQDRRQRGHTGP